MSGIRDYRCNLNNLIDDSTTPVPFHLTKAEVSKLPERISDRALTHARINEEVNASNILLVVDHYGDKRGCVSWSQLITAFGNVVLETKRLERVFIKEVNSIICEMVNKELIYVERESGHIVAILMREKGRKKIASAVKFSNFIERLSI